ncbi:hypothetical protein F0L74_06540 [Chitinophaga agrisoli]|uniref:SGNH hydrolase-type esterase domain-containing protein n=1 Tax=Chitinophaga agrisoli TaxID=2607653 RepID=A0A5B2W4I1_9BACT|nr:hypothetical protein F0L74_06540 [Chitinophaga agrisoli]
MNISRRYTHKVRVIERITKYLVFQRWLPLCMAAMLATASVQAQHGPNTIQQDTALNRFFAALQQADSNVVSVLHLGDSHIQAGYFPEATCAGLQQQFGNAGRGWVFPFNLAGTNGPDDYRWNSNVRWQPDKVIDRHKDYEPGPGGIVITTQSAAPALSFNGQSGQGPDDEVHVAELFYDAGTAGVHVTAPDAEVAVTPVPYAGTETLSMATLTFQETVQSFQARWDSNGSAPFHFYGAVLRNGHNGVLYHAIGINGAMYQHYVESSSTLVSQMQALQPQLVIISLGTNEAYSGLSASAITEQIDNTVRLMREQFPEACFVLTTPPECMRTARRAFRKKVGKKYRTYYRISYYPNAAITMVTQQIVSYCRNNGLACWNFNAVNRSMKQEFAGGWAQDHIHFNARGYQLQGRLLSQALQDAYKTYAEKNQQ